MLPRTDDPSRKKPVVRVALHHPQQVWVDSLERLLEPRWDVEVVVAHTSATWVCHAVMTGRVDVILLHLTSADPGLTDLLAGLRRGNPELQAVGLSDSTDNHVLVSAARAGVRGWVEPTSSTEHLVKVLQGVVMGETWIPPTLLTPVMATLLESEETREEANSVMSTLSPREEDVLSCLVQGLSRQEIAERYVLSPHTVRTHITNLLRKLDVHSTLAAVYLARQAGLVERGQP